MTVVTLGKCPNSHCKSTLKTPFHELHMTMTGDFLLLCRECKCILLPCEVCRQLVPTKKFKSNNKRLFFNFHDLLTFIYSSASSFGAKYSKQEDKSTLSASNARPTTLDWFTTAISDIGSRCLNCGGITILNPSARTLLLGTDKCMDWLMDDQQIVQFQVNQFGREKYLKFKQIQLGKIEKKIEKEISKGDDQDKLLYKQHWSVIKLQILRTIERLNHWTSEKEKHKLGQKNQHCKQTMKLNSPYSLNFLIGKLKQLECIEDRLMIQLERDIDLTKQLIQNLMDKESKISMEDLLKFTYYEGVNPSNTLNAYFELLRQQESLWKQQETLNLFIVLETLNLLLNKLYETVIISDIDNKNMNDCTNRNIKNDDQTQRSFEKFTRIEAIHLLRQIYFKLWWMIAKFSV